MKREFFYIHVDKRIADHISSLGSEEITLTDLSRLDKPQYKHLKEMLNNKEEGMMSKTVLHIFQNAESYGIKPEVLQLVYDCFIDIFCKRPSGKEGQLGKLDSVLERIKLQSWPEDHDDEAFIGIARIRIPLVEEKQQNKDDENKSQSSEIDHQSEKKSEKGGDKEGEGKEGEGEGKEGEGDGEGDKEPAGPKMVEIEFEDKVTLVNPKGEEKNIYVTTQAGSRFYRQDIASNLKKLTSEWDEIEIDDVLELSEKISDKMENDYLGSLGLPIFDFEIN